MAISQSRHVTWGTHIQDPRKCSPAISHIGVTPSPSPHTHAHRQFFDLAVIPGGRSWHNNAPAAVWRDTSWRPALYPHVPIFRYTQSHGQKASLTVRLMGKVNVRARWRFSLSTLEKGKHGNSMQSPWNSLLMAMFFYFRDIQLFYSYFCSSFKKHEICFTKVCCICTCNPVSQTNWFWPTRQMWLIL